MDNHDPLALKPKLLKAHGIVPAFVELLHIVVAAVRIVGRLLDQRTTEPIVFALDILDADELGMVWNAQDVACAEQRILVFFVSSDVFDLHVQDLKTHRQLHLCGDLAT